jgi:hypothetical protein
LIGPLRICTSFTVRTSRNIRRFRAADNFSRVLFFAQRRHRATKRSRSSYRFTTASAASGFVSKFVASILFERCSKVTAPACITSGQAFEISGHATHNIWQAVFLFPQDLNPSRRRWLSHYVISRKVAGSRTDKLNDFYQFT